MSIADETTKHDEESRQVAEIVLNDYRSQPWETLRLQITKASATRSFYLVRGKLDAISALTLSQYLRDDCTARFVDLSYLDGWSEIAMAAATALHRGLREVRSLVLDGNNLCSHTDVFEAWCEALDAHPGLQHLSLRNTNLGDTQCIQLAALLKHNSTLFSLDLSCNHISDESVLAFIDALDENRVLLEIVVDGTHSGEESRAALVHVLERNRLLYGTRRNPLDALRNLRKACAESISVADASVGLQNETARGGIKAKFDACFTRDFPNHQAVPEHPLHNECDVDLSPSSTSSPSWRQAAVHENESQELRSQACALEAVCEREKELFEAALKRITEQQKTCQEHLTPLEAQLIALRETLEAELSAKGTGLRQKMQLELQLKQVTEKHDLAVEESRHAHLSLEKLQSSLRWKHRQEAESTLQLTQELASAEAAVADLEKENEKLRGYLRAIRFDPELIAGPKRYVQCVPDSLKHCGT